MRMTVSFYSMVNPRDPSQKEITLLGSIPNKTYNRIIWSPQGNYLGKRRATRPSILSGWGSVWEGQDMFCLDSLYAAAHESKLGWSVVEHQRGVLF
jgi:hypothetical protein